MRAEPRKPGGSNAQNCILGKVQTGSHLANGQRAKFSICLHGKSDGGERDRGQRHNVNNRKSEQGAKCENALGAEFRFDE